MFLSAVAHVGKAPLLMFEFNNSYLQSSLIHVQTTIEMCKMQEITLSQP